MTIQHRQERQPERIQFARTQRKSANEFAADVWQMVRGRRMLDVKFRREYPLGPYTLDFASVEIKLNVEIDGKDHLTDEGRERDHRRDAFVREKGWTVLRINGYRVTQDPRGVREEIERVVKGLVESAQGAPPPQPPSPKRGEGSQCGGGAEPKRGEGSQCGGGAEPKRGEGSQCGSGGEPKRGEGSQIQSGDGRGPAS